MFVPAILAIIGAFIFIFEALRHRKTSQKINSEIKELKELKKHSKKNQIVNLQNIVKHKNGEINVKIPNQNPQDSQNLNRVGIAVGAAAAVGGAAYMANKALNNKPNPDSRLSNKPPKKRKRKKFLGIF